MKLLFVHERFGAFAGAEVNLLLTAEELSRRGHTLAILHGDGTGKGEDAWRGVFPERFGIGASAEIARAIEKFSPDCVYVHKLVDVAALEAVLNSQRPSARMVHDHDLYCMRSYKYHPLTRKVCERPASLACVFPCGAILARNRNGGLPFKWMSYRDKKREIAVNRKFDRMVVATEYMRRELLRNGFAPERIEIHAPVPRFDEAKQVASFSERNLIVFAGQIIRGKGVDVLLEALARVTQPFECVILGDGNHRAKCEELSRKLGLASRVKFLGYVPPAEMTKFYADASVAVVSSVWPEPFGAVGLEAMRYGLPVVAFDAGGIREWLVHGQTGFLVPWMNRAEFAERIDQVLEYKQVARQLGAKGREVAREKFNFGKYIDGLEAMFARMTARPATALNV